MCHVIARTGLSGACLETKTAFRHSNLANYQSSGVAKGGGSQGSCPPPLGGLDSENFIVESVVHTAELDVFFNHL